MITSDSETTNALKMWRQCADQLGPQNESTNEHTKLLQNILCAKIKSLERIEVKLSFGGESSPEMFAMSLTELKKKVSSIN